MLAVGSTNLLSTTTQLHEIKDLIRTYAQVPLAQLTSSLLENIIAHVKGGWVPGGYAFTDVVAGSYGLQVKLACPDTPITWKRVKIAGSDELITASRHDTAALQVLGDRVIAECNSHVRDSFVKFNLSEIGYGRLILRNDRTVQYFERSLCTANTPELFNASDYSWQWSLERVSHKTNKQLLPALHGMTRTGERVFSWHGRGENQLHFTGEKAWWPSRNAADQVIFSLPEQLSLDEFKERFATCDD